MTRKYFKKFRYPITDSKILQKSAQIKTAQDTHTADMQTTAVFNPVCALCGKKFENCSFLFKHIAGKHAASSALSSETPLLQSASACAASSGPPSEAPLLQSASAASSGPPSEAPLLQSASAASSGPPSEAPLLHDTKRKIKREAGNARKKRRRGGFNYKVPSNAWVCVCGVFYYSIQW